MTHVVLRVDAAPDKVTLRWADEVGQFDPPYTLAKVASSVFRKLATGARTCLGELAETYLEALRWADETGRWVT